MGYTISQRIIELDYRGIDFGGGGGGPPTPTPFRYYRLTIDSWSNGGGTPVNTSGNARVTELRLYQGESDYPSSAMTGNSAPTPLVATESSDSGASFPVWHAFDQTLDDSHRWLSATGSGVSEWIQVDLGSGNDITVDFYKIAPDSTASTGNFLSEWILAGSDTGAFAGEETEIDHQYSHNASNEWTNSTYRGFRTYYTPLLTESHRYWRVTNVIIPSAGTSLEITGLELHSDGVHISGSATLSSSDAPATGALANLVDEDDLTFCSWAAATVQNYSGFWVKYDFGTAKKVNAVAQRMYTNSDRYAYQLELQYSDDDATWTSLGIKPHLLYAGNGKYGRDYEFWSYPTYTYLDYQSKTSGITLSNPPTIQVAEHGGLTASGLGGTYQSVGSVQRALETGKWYWEITVSTFSSGSGQLILGVHAGQDYYPGGTNWTAYGTYCSYRSQGTYYVRGGTVANFASGSTYTEGDVMMFALDVDNGKMWTGKNGTWNNSGDPAAGTNESFNTLPTVGWRPTIQSDNEGGTVTVTANFGATSFNYTVPSGFTSGII